MTKIPQNITVIGAGNNGLVAANYLVRAGHQVTLLERNDRVGGACVSETVEVDGIQQDYPLGATVLGVMQDYVWRETGLADRLRIWAPGHPNLALGKTGEQLAGVEAEVKQIILSFIANPEDCVWTRLLTPRDLQQTFGFPGGNIEHTMLVARQSYFDRQYADDANRRFYQFGAFENVSICGSSTYPCGSVTGTPGYMGAS